MDAVEQIMYWAPMVFTVGVVIWYLFGLYLVYFKLKEMMSYLKTAFTFRNHEAYFSDGLRWRFQLLGEIEVILGSPGVAIQRGNATAKELENFPTGLKRALIIHRWFIWISIWLAIVFHVVHSFWIAYPACI